MRYGVRIRFGGCAPAFVDRLLALAFRRWRVMVVDTMAA